MECDRCHRQKPESQEAFDASLEWGGECLVNSAFGVSGPNEAADCDAARDAWQVAEIARLTAEVERLRKPRWVQQPQAPADCPSFELRAPFVAVPLASLQQHRWLDGAPWYSEGPKLRAAYYATEAEARAAAEKACGVEVRDGM